MSKHPVTDAIISRNGDVAEPLRAPTVFVADDERPEPTMEALMASVKAKRDSQQAKLKRLTEIQSQQSALSQEACDILNSLDA